MHFDLPWTAARMEQRVGRVARLGSGHARVAVYALCPPADAELLLGIERRLCAKLEAAGRSVGVAGSILPASLVPSAARGDGSSPPLTSPVQYAAIARATVASWRDAASDGRTMHLAARDGSVVATVGASVNGIVAACIVGGTSILVALLGEGAGPITDRLSIVARAVQLAAEGRDAPTHDADVAVRARAALVRWAERRLAQRDAGLAGGVVAHERRHILARMAAIVRRTPPHRRGQVAALATAARRSVLVSRGIGAEWGLGTLARDTERPDEAWLDAVAAQSGGAATASSRAASTEVRVPALILLRCA